MIKGESIHALEAFRDYSTLWLIRQKVVLHRVKGFPKGDIISMHGMHVGDKFEYEVREEIIEAEGGKSINSSIE